jgi:hypothetical protein
LQIGILAIFRVARATVSEHFKWMLPKCLPENRITPPEMVRGANEIAAMQFLIPDEQ